MKKRLSVNLCQKKSLTKNTTKPNKHEYIVIELVKKKQSLGGVMEKKSC